MLYLGKTLDFGRGAMARDLYEDLSKIEDRGKRLNKKASDSHLRPEPNPARANPEPGNSINSLPPRANLEPGNPTNAAPTRENPGQSNPVKANPDSNYEGNNGGAIEESRFYKRDIYGDLEKIEERGKRKKGKLSLFGRRKN